MKHFNDLKVCEETGQIIWDESGIAIGEARPITEPTDIDLDRLPGCLDDSINLQLPNILDDDVLPESGLYPEHDSHLYCVVEADNVFDRTQFILDYLAARDNDAARIRNSWW